MYLFCLSLYLGSRQVTGQPLLVALPVNLRGVVISIGYQFVLFLEFFPFYIVFHSISPCLRCL